MTRRFSAGGILISFVAVVSAFLAGLGVGALEDHTETPPPELVEVPVPEGDFEDVPLTMKSGSTGGTWRYVCDFHFHADRTAECEHRP